LQARCAQPNAAARPLFADIAQALTALQHHIGA
jgi:hypothetical protein